MPSVRAIPTQRFKLGHPKRQPSALTRASATHPRWSRYLIPASLFVITMLLTTLIGMRCMYDFRNGQPPFTSLIDLFPYRWDWTHLDLFASGLPFSATLVSILLACDLGQYFARRYFRVEPALSHIVPVSVLAVVWRQVRRTNSKIKSRSALIAISAAGPMAGFAVAAATTCYGLMHSTVIGLNTTPSLIRLSAPSLIGMLRSTMLASFPDIPPVLQMLPHPVLLASWIGLLITAIRLIPAGQSDGGRIVYAISPRLHRTTSTAAIAVLLYMGTVEWVGWLFGAVLLIVSTLRRPRLADHTPPGLEWLALAPVCFTIFMLTASTQPVIGMNLVQVLLRIHWGVGIR